MFIKHENSKQLDMFSSAGSVLSERALKKLNDENAWQNVFRKYCFDQIDEEIYKFMFCADNGRPNQSVKVMLGMMILKEAFGYTDERLFEACDFNICLRQAIGLFNLNEDRPSDSTYYEFRAKIAKHLAETGEDLIEMTFNGVTSNQLETLDISGKKVRMDSKLLQSINMAAIYRKYFVYLGMEKQDFRKLDESTRYAFRKQAIKLINSGHKKSEVAGIIGVKPGTISEWWKLYKDNGINGLKSKKKGVSSEDKKLISSAQEIAIQKMIVDKMPDQLKLPYGLWTRKAVKELVEREFGVKVAINTMG